jgi:hypothetical protein
MSSHEDIMTSLGWYPLREAERRVPTSDDFTRIEQRSGGALPTEYRSFVAKYGQGAPTRTCWFPIPGGSSWGSWGLLDRFIGASTDSGDGFPDAVFDLFEDQIPRGTVPIAYDPGGNLVLLAVGDATKPLGSVWFWDHERRASSSLPAGQTVDDTYFVANSFDEFLRALQTERGRDGVL